jgi:hypothetical protein
MNVAPFCICTTVSAKALQALLEASGRGTYRDDRPWLVARDMLHEAETERRRLAIVFATGPASASHASRFSHWGFIETLQVVELHRASWETACTFTALHPVNPIFEALDSLFLKPTAEQLTREHLEGIPRHRYPLTEAELRPYAICETPAFILKES